MTDGSTLDRVWRDERAGIVGSLARRFGDLGLAEDAAQEAVAAAAQRWPVDGVPDRPGAWLMTTAHRKAIGMLRRRRPTEQLQEHSSATPGPDADGAPSDDLERDLFGLLLACCHPSLNADARIALTLRHVCGLTDQEIAAALLVAEPTLTKRLVRARRKIRDAGISFEPPALADLDDRVDDVHTVIYLLFTEGYLSASSEQTLRGDLCDEAIWLARQVHRLRPEDAETNGLLGLMLVQHSRRDARRGGDGSLLTLGQQDRSRWDTDALDEARHLLAEADPRGLGPYQVECAIALLHVTDDEPNWPRIADLYRVLATLAPSPIVEVNRAVAVGHADGAEAGLAVITDALADGRLDDYAPAHAAHAHLLERAGRPHDAAGAWRSAAAATVNDGQRSVMLGEVVRIERADPDGDPTQ